MGDSTHDGAVMASLRRHMTIQAARQVISASNLANVSTPGYKARQLDFDRALDDSLGAGQMSVTNARHIKSSRSDVTRASTEIEGAEARRDGNTVQLDRELLEMTSAAGEFARAQTALAAKFRLVRYAITESR